MAKYEIIMQASLPGSLQSEEFGFCFLEKCEHCLNTLLKEGVSPGGFIHIFFRKRKPQGVSDMKCFCHLLIWGFWVFWLIFIFVWLWFLKAVYMHILVHYHTFLNASSNVTGFYRGTNLALQTILWLWSSP